MAAKKNRRTIGANPLDELLENQTSDQDQSELLNILKKPAASSEETEKSATPTKRVRRAGTSAKRPAKAKEQVNSKETLRDADSRSSAQSADALLHAKSKEQVQDQHQTAEALFEAECKAGHDFSPRRELVRVAPKNVKRAPAAMAIVKRWSQWSVAAGVVPVPFLDTVAISGVQLKMVHDLCKHYGVEFEKEAVLAIAGSLVGGAITTSVTDAVTHMLLKSVPYAEQVLQPTLSFATTYSLGYVFVKHFEDNGTLKDFKASKMKGYFHEQLEQTKSVFSMRKQKAAG